MESAAAAGATEIENAKIRANVSAVDASRAKDDAVDAARQAALAMESAKRSANQARESLTLVRQDATATRSESISLQAQRLDKLAKLVEQYGFITASTPILMPAGGEGESSPFEFGLRRGAEQYYTDARTDIQGVVAQVEESIAELAIQGSVGSDRTRAEAVTERNARADALAQAQSEIDSEVLRVAKQEYESSIAIAAAETDSGKSREIRQTATDRYLATLRAVRTTAGAGSGESIPAFPDPRALLPSAGIGSGQTTSITAPAAPFALRQALSTSPPRVSNRSAIITAAGDNAVEGIFRVLGSPQDAERFSGRRLFYGVTMVAVTPGHRTRKKYAADIAMLVSVSAREVSNGGRADLAALETMPDALALRLGCDDGSLEACRGRNVGAQTVVLPRLPLPSSVNSFLGRALVNAMRRAEEEAKSKGSPSPDGNVAAPKDECRVINAMGTTTVPSRTLAWKCVPPELRGAEVVVVDFRSRSREGSQSPSDIHCAADSDGYRVRCSYGRAYAPQVAAVSPMTEAQVLDLGSATRSRQRLALDLASALVRQGDSRAARVFADFARQAQQDAVSRTARNLVTGYGTDRLVGFQVGPGYAAIGDLDRDSSEPVLELQRQSFPALMLFGVSDEIARPRVFLVKNGENADCDLPWAGSDGKPGCRLVVLRPHLDIQQVTRWTPRRKLFAPFFRISESEFFDVLGGATVLEGVNIARRDDGEGDVVLEALEARTSALRTLVAPGVVSIPVPEKASDLSAPLSVKNLAPMLVTLDSGKDGNPVPSTRVSFVIRGTGLGGEQLKCFVTGAGPAIETQLVQLDSADAAICEAALAPDNAGKLVVAVGQKVENAVLGGQIEVRKPVKPSPDKPPPSPALRYEIKTAAGTVEHAVYGPNGVTSATAERLIKSEIEKSKAPSSQADVSINVQAPATSGPNNAP